MLLAIGYKSYSDRTYELQVQVDRGRWILHKHWKQSDLLKNAPTWSAYS